MRGSVGSVELSSLATVGTLTTVTVPTGGFRPDVMMYIVEALKTFKKVGPEKVREIAVEIAIVGRTGLDIKDSDSKYKLKSLPGTYSGLHLLAIMYTAFKHIDPSMETGCRFLCRVSRSTGNVSEVVPIFHSSAFC